MAEANTLEVEDLVEEYARQADAMMRSWSRCWIILYMWSCSNEALAGSQLLNH